MNKEFRKYVLNYEDVFTGKDKTLGEFCDENNINLESISLKELNEKLINNGFNPIPDKYIVVSNIKWDLDESDDVKLPEEITVNYEQFSSAENIDELEEMISDYISYIIGFCHDGFDYKIVNVEDM